MERKIPLGKSLLYSYFNHYRIAEKQATLGLKPFWDIHNTSGLRNITKIHSIFKTQQKDRPLLEAAKKGLIHHNHRFVQFLRSPQKSSSLHRYILETMKSEAIKGKGGKKKKKMTLVKSLMYSLPPSGVTEGHNVKFFTKLLNVDDKTVLSLEQ